MSKPLHAGRAAEAGVLAALLAARGVTGADDMRRGGSMRPLGRAPLYLQADPFVCVFARIQHEGALREQQRVDATGVIRVPMR